MKRLLAISIIIFAFSACKPVKGPNGVTYKTVVEYNDYIVDRQLKTIQSIKDMASLVGNNNAKALVMLKEISAKSLENAKDVEGMPAWKGNTNFRDKAVGIFNFYGTTYCNDFKELIELADNPEISETERAGLKGKGEAIDNAEEKMNQGFLKAQKEFSEANHLRLEKRVDD